MLIKIKLLQLTKNEAKERKRIQKQPLRDVLVKKLLSFGVSNQNTGKNVYKNTQFQFSGTNRAILLNINFLIDILHGHVTQIFGQLLEKNQINYYFSTEKNKHKSARKINSLPVPLA